VENVIQTAKSPEEMLLLFLSGTPVTEEFINKQKKLYEKTSSPIQIQRRHEMEFSWRSKE
jgi:hypothetical protein